MTPDDLFTAAEKNEIPDKTSIKTEEKPVSNVAEFSVSDLAQSLKKTLEDTYGHIRVRGELSGLKVAASGHLYGDIKDENANVNIVCWRGTLGKLSVRPEEGMEVIVTGKVSSYPKSSRYQIIIEKMELAGEGALLKMLEERRKKLAKEGLFDESRKKPLPLLPGVIGVITSPSGAVIRDILHRLKDRFPRHVLLWPVNVQGQGAAQQITSAIEGFNNLSPNLGVFKPDLLIVARGGGSLEDLMPFNEENVVRAVANSDIPVISAVGHETDTTLIDHAADLRAPTPTGAAEMAVPVRLQIHTTLQNHLERLTQAMSRHISEQTNHLQLQAAKLGDPSRLLDTKAQNLDILEGRLHSSLKSLIHTHHVRLKNVTTNMTHPRHLLEQKTTLTRNLEQRLTQSGTRVMLDKKNQLSISARMLDTLSPKAVLGRGYALVYDETGQIIRTSKNVTKDQNITIELANDDKLDAKIR
ncbi:MAG: exodeoxyribonuclease VII large subunit [Alphaproteobacteria bacterium]|nr:exodeoxyribonuclease VII large subunit [Alphaproteobacteria bacterium]